MEKVLNILSDLNGIEEKATAIVDHTSIEKKALYKQLTEDINKLDEAISADTKQKLDVMRAKMNVEIEAAKKELLTSFDEDMSRIESDYKKNHDNYVETVFQKIINE
ncbi:MAG: hypothetical protein ACERKN_04195 [Velocimicrobium sp.]